MNDRVARALAALKQEGSCQFTESQNYGVTPQFGPEHVTAEGVADFRTGETRMRYRIAVAAFRPRIENVGKARWWGRPVGRPVAKVLDVVVDAMDGEREVFCTAGRTYVYDEESGSWIAQAEAPEAPGVRPRIDPIHALAYLEAFAPDRPERSLEDPPAGVEITGTANLGRIADQLPPFLRWQSRSLLQRRRMSRIPVTVRIDPEGRLTTLTYAIGGTGDPPFWTRVELHDPGAVLERPDLGAAPGEDSTRRSAGFA